MERTQLPKLLIVGTLAGLFSGFFGVGGGTVIVPLLVLWFGYGEREATGTSLVAIVLIATVAVVVQTFYGNVDFLKGVMIGLPAVGGVMFGAWLQQRIPVRTLSLLFAALLAAVGVDFLWR